MKKVNYLFKEHAMHVDIWESKKALFKAFYQAFYEFIKSNGGEEDLHSHNIFNVDDFYAYADYYADGKENCYAMGFSFHKYFLTTCMNGSLETQPTSTFVGYCYQNNMFKDFLQFLVSFFAYWRNDEGCTCFDPYNYADNFFISAWASLVDTSKLFYFTAETVYWWQSFRVKYVLDNIPGLMISKMPNNDLSPIRVTGYEFLNWVDQDGNVVTSLDSVDTVYADMKRKDVYNYWEKEEKKIKKVYVEDWKRVDPA